jgi:hypothetical protein
MPFSGSSSSSGSGSAGVKEGRKQPGPPPVVLNPHARGRAEAAQVRGHVAGDHGPAGQPRLLAHHRREARGKISLHVKFSLLASAS